MKKNHLLIGLGGTGGKVLRAFRKALYNSFRHSFPGDLALDYLYVDSDPELMTPEDPSWRTLGANLQLPPESQLHLSPVNVQAIRRNPAEYPGIAGWIGDFKAGKEEAIDSKRARQNRRLGRLLFAGQATAFRQRIQEKVQTLQQSGETSVTFHICCGLAGGVGGGCLPDVIALIRSAFPQSRSHRILLYTLLPEREAPPGWDKGNYHANGYAALLELNALSVGAYSLADVTGEQAHHALTDPFNGCYVLGNENNRGQALEVNQEVPAMIADFLFQKIVAFRAVPWESLRRMEIGEEGERHPESSHPASGKRSRRFFTFGVKRLHIPLDEVRDYLAACFAREASLQLLSAQSDRPELPDFDDYCARTDTQQRWLLTDSHLILESPLLDHEIQDTNWRTINGHWQGTLAPFKDYVRDRFPDNPAIWLDELARLFEACYRSDYGERGIQGFYQGVTDAPDAYLQAIRARIEHDLIEGWRTNTYALDDVRRLLRTLIDSLKPRQESLRQQAIALVESERKAVAEIEGERDEWNRAASLPGFSGKRDALFDAQAERLQARYALLTRRDGSTFAIGFLDALQQELTDLLNEIETCATTIRGTIPLLQRAIDSSCTDTGSPDIRQREVRFYSPKQVKSFAVEMLLNQAEQTRQVQSVRSAFLLSLGHHPTFSLFNQQYPPEAYRIQLIKQCDTNVRQSYEKYRVAKPDASRILDDNIVERLLQSYASDPDGLLALLHQWVLTGGNYVSFRTFFRSEKTHEAEEGDVRDHPPLFSTIIFLPETRAYPGFHEQLKQAFRQSASGPFQFLPSPSLPCEVKPHEMTLVTVADLFPLRYLENTAWLRERYESRLAGPQAARVRWELHGEGDGSQHPSLFPPVRKRR